MSSKRQRENECGNSSAPLRNDNIGAHSSSSSTTESRLADNESYAKQPKLPYEEYGEDSSISGDDDDESEESEEKVPGTWTRFEGLRHAKESKAAGVTGGDPG